MYNQSGRYDEVLGETYKPPRGGLVDKYRATKAPNRGVADKFRATKAPARNRESVADSDVSFGWVDDVDYGKSPKPAPADQAQDLGKSRRGELSNWNGLGVTRGREYDNQTSTYYDDMAEERNIPSANGLGVTRGRGNEYPRSTQHDERAVSRNPPLANGLGVTRGHEGEYTRSMFHDDIAVGRKPPSGKPPSGKPPSGRPPQGQSVGGENMRNRPPKGPITPRRKETDEPALHRDQVPMDESRQESWAGWRTRAIRNPGDGDESWGKLFGRMHLRWSGREQRKQALPPGSMTTLDDPRDEGRKDDSQESGNHPRKRKSRTLIAIVICVSILVLAVVVVVPTVVLTRSDENEDPSSSAFVAFNYQAKSDDLTFDPEMSDPTSSVFINLSQEFCSGIDQLFAGSDKAGQYTGCEVTELRNGSVLYVFNIFFEKVSGVNPTEGDVQLTILAITQQGITFTVGIVTFQTESLSLIGVSEVAVVSFSNVKCPEITSFENGIITYIGNSFNDEATVVCVSGYVNAGDATITCTQTYDWSSQPNCTKVTCVNYTIPENSIIDPSTLSGNTYKTNITVTCKPGFVLNGSDKSMCMANGNWSESPTCEIISCPENTIPDNSQITPDSPDLTYGSSYSVNCNAGFEKGHDDNVTCLTNGTWSPVPTCDAIECVQYAIPDNSTIEPPMPSGNTYGTNLTVTCNPGYDIDGENIVSCADDGTWSASPMCNIKSCPDITAPDNSQTDPPTPTLTYGSTFDIVCNEGYASDDEVEVTCGDDGTWSPSPECSIIVCEEFSAVENGVTEPEDTTNLQYNSTISVTCNGGYVLSSENSVKCQTNKTWSLIPSCDPVECGEFTQPSNSNFEGVEATTGRTFMDVLTLKCDSGFIIEGDNEVTCLATGVWSNSPTCNAVACPNYTVPANAETEPSDISGHTFNNTIDIICNDGYEIMGESPVTCQEDGTWSNIPSCTPVKCPDLAAPENGMTDPQNVENLTFNTIVNISCNIGYTLAGVDTVQCLANESWSGTIATCEPIDCNAFTFPLNSFEAEMNITSNTPTKYKDEISVNCTDGFVLVGPKSFTCNATGYWPEVTCQTVECDTSAIEKPNLAIGGVKADVYTLQCDIGYTLEGNETISCVEGNWTDIPDCQIVSCSSLESPHNGTVTSDGINFGDSAELVCDFGFEGSMQFECKASGTWSGTPSCTAVTCTDFELTNGTFTTDFETPYSYTNTLALSCNEGFEATGALAITCEGDGNWTDDTKCQPVECTESIDIEHGETNPELTRNLTFGETVEVTCSLGYEMNSSSQIECKSNGELSGKPTCNIVHCPDFDIPAHSEIAGTTDTSFESNVSIACNDGYEIEGRSFSICQSNKTWTQVGSCKPKECEEHDLTGDLQTLDGSTQLTGKVFGENVNVNCSNDKLLVGDQHIFCNTDGTWTINTSCIATDCEINSFNRPDHSKVVEANNTHLKVNCDDGYTMSGDASVLCSNAVWSVPPNCTIVSCGNLEDPENGKMSSSGTTYLDTAILTCDEGYDSKDSSMQFECKASGTWSGTPSCTAVTCTDFELTNGAFTTDFETPYSYTNTLALSCNEGFEATGALTITCEGDGNWTDDTKCQPVECTESIDIEHGEINPELTRNLTFGETVEVTCSLGYEMNRSSQIECKSNGELSGKPTCNIVHCPDFDIPAHSEIAGTTDTSFESNVSIACNDGYEIEGRSFSICQSNKTWTQVGSCEPKECEEHDLTGDLQTLDGSTQLTGKVFGENVNVNCSNDKLLVGDQHIFCNTDGTWSINTSCIATDCKINTFNIPDHSKVIEANNTYLKVDCDDGYTISGDASVLCSNAVWSVPSNCTIVSCGNFADPENGKMSSSGTTYLDTANLTCDEGHDPKDSSESFICLASGEWNDTAECEVLDCGDPELPENADSFVTSSNEFGTREMNVSCKQGFELENPVTIQCTADKTWTGLPSCKPVKCEDLEVPEHSELLEGSANDTYFGGNAMIECINGYEFESESDGILDCLSNKTWTTVPECVKVECIVFEAPEHGSIVDEIKDNKFEDVVEIKCDVGYTLSEDGMITCQSNKSWTASPECNIVLCADNPQIENGMLDVQVENDREYGDVADIVCDEGYELQADSIVTCEANGSWSGLRNCTKIDCEQPMLPDNAADIQIPDTLYGAKVNITCQDGYALDGNALIECMSDGNWTSISDCEPVSCLDYDTPENGVDAVENGITFNETVTFECDEGYTLNGSDIITCQADGNWTQGPTCDIVDCGEIDPIVDGTYNNGLPTTFNQTIQITCNTGYKLSGEDIIVCQSNGSWSEIPSCFPVECPAIDPPSKGSFEASLTSDGYYGDVKNISCDQGYTVDGPVDITCTSNKTWTVLPSCTPVKCEAINIPDNSEVVEGSVDNSYFGNAVEIQCDSGYEFVDSEIDGVINCLYNQSWSEIPECVRIECPVYQAPENGIIVDNSMDNTFEDSIEVECNTGYTLSENGTLFCMAEKTWSGSPECNIVICEEDPSIENGRIDVEDVNDREYEDDVYILCDEGYEIDVNASVRCEANGSWTGIKPCAQVDCGEFSETIENGTVLNSTGTTYGESVYLDCNEGFLLVGKSVINCLQNGSWGRPPVCEETECIDPNITSGSYTKKTGTIYEVICDDGHILIGDQFIECQTDTSWDHIPTCSELICGNYTEDFTNGEILDLTGTRYGDTVSFMCNEGYTLNGPETISCNELGDWEMKPSCDIIDCGNPPASENGNYTTDETVFNTTVHVECDSGYTLEDGVVDSITCQSSGNWTAGGGTCVEIDCGNFTVNGVPKSVTYTSGTMYGSVATVECEDGYQLVGENSAICTGIGGWSAFVVCSSIGNVTFDSSSYEFSVGSPGYITCDVQDAENWTSVIIADRDGSTLASVNRTESGTIRGTVSERFQIADTSVFTTNDASLVFGLTSVECADQGPYFCGVAVDELRKIEDFTQTEIKVTSNADVPSLAAPDMIAYNETAELSCDGLLGATATNESVGTLQLQVRRMMESNFSVLEEDPNPTDEDCNKRGSIQFSFNADNSWDQAEVKCVTDTGTDTFESNSTVISVTASCGDQPFIESGIFVNVTDGSGDVILTVECDVGYENLGAVNITCTSSSWSGEPNCFYIDCGLPGDLSPALFVIANETSSIYDSVIDGHCENGYIPEQIFGEGNFIICDDNGEWNSSFSCQPVECSAFEVPSAASVVFENGTTYGSRVQIKCDEGFNLAGNESTAVCSAEARWVGSNEDSGDTPVCTSVGGLTVGSESYTPTVGGALLVTCNLSSTPE